jgi:hypothetical protein
MEGLNEGRIVHYVMPNNQNRAALVVRVFTHLAPEHDGMANLYVFLDGLNDQGQFPDGSVLSGQGVTIYWATSVHYSEEPLPGTWHWIFPGQATYRQDRQK